MMPMRRRIAGMKPDEIKALDKDELSAPLQMADFEEAISKISSSVSKEDIERYEKWMREFGSQ